MFIVLEFSSIFDEIGGEVTCVREVGGPKVGSERRLSGRREQHSDSGCSSGFFSERILDQENVYFCEHVFFVVFLLVFNARVCFLGNL